LVDFVSEEDEIAGKFAALEVQGKLSMDLRQVEVKKGDDIRTCVPQRLSLPAEGEAVKLFMRVMAPERSVKLEVLSGSEVIMNKVLPVAKPSEMIALELSAEKTKLIGNELIVRLSRGV
ncbi:MAG: pyridine nucleotide-disulfide oxidoreductase, partial [Acholeplasmataceae bacterium]|nr:pyridine nucleotide-disulfide oxidoreductase [Acholeplasmataceae bacterium]